MAILVSRISVVWPFGHMFAILRVVYSGAKGGAKGNTEDASACSTPSCRGAPYSFSVFSVFVFVVVMRPFKRACLC